MLESPYKPMRLHERFGIGILELSSGRLRTRVSSIKIVLNDIPTLHLEINLAFEVVSEIFDFLHILGVQKISQADFPSRVNTRLI